MQVSVIIPTRGRPEKLARCLIGLGRQDYPHADFEVLVGVDGEDDPASIPAALHADTTHSVRMELHVYPRMGQASVRNRLLERAHGKLIICINDDVYPEPSFCRVHATEGLQRIVDGRPAILIGHSPYLVHEPDRLFDRMLRETSLTFFYDRMLGDANPERDWGFRHTFGLNMSFPAASARAVGGFGVFPEFYGYEDLEIGWKLATRERLPVLFRPGAVAQHDHRMDPGDYLARERTLGRAAWGFAGVAPECALATFGRDVRSDAETAYSRAFVEREAAAAERLRASFLRTAEIPASAAGGRWGGEFVNAAYEAHLLLKRWEWRKGLLEGAGVA